MKMNFRLLLTAAFLFAASLTFAQRGPTYQADLAFDKGDYYDAAALYKKAFTKEKNKVKRAEVIYKVAESYRLTNDYKNQEVWGTDGTIPKTNYQSITIKIDGKTIEIPVKEMENLFNPNAENSECYYDEKNKKLFIISMNADGAGSYEILFTIENGKYRGRSVYLAN